DGAASPHQLWRIDYPSGAAQRITNEVAEYRGVSLTNEDIVTVRMDRSWQIWVTPIDQPANAVPIFSGAGLSYGLTWTSKGKLVFSSLAAGTLNLLQTDPDGTAASQLTFGSDENYNPVASADGQFIVFSSNRGGSFNI